MPTVKLYANLRKLAGTKELSITGGTVRAVVNELARQNPSVGEVILENGEVRQHIIVTRNGQNITDLEAPVVEQDIIAIFPPIAGGTSPLTPLLLGEGNQGEAHGWLV
ncbi:MAG TPA: ubiquitin-like small modifier protein 1 [Anaerolineales bacterium]|nr:ubiquitin-like small modifier protein 1 [Anaerolineales bacterium]